MRILGLLAMALGAWLLLIGLMLLITWGVILHLPFELMHLGLLFLLLGACGMSFPGTTNHSSDVLK